MGDRARAPRPLPAAATWGLFAAWAVHDAEEPAAMPGWADRERPAASALLE